MLSPVAIEIEPDEPPDMDDPLRNAIDPDSPIPDEDVSIVTPDIPNIDSVDLDTDPENDTDVPSPSDTPVAIITEPPISRPLPPSIDIDPP